MKMVDTPLPLQAAYLQALRVGSGRQADTIVTQGLDDGLTANDIYLQLFQPTAYTIGQLWQRNEFSVAQEHLATAIMERQMGDLHTYFKPRRTRSHTVVIGCVEQEQHQLGSRMVADFFEQDGWNVYYLGASVPSEAFVALAREVHADLIGLSSQMVHHLPAITEFVRTLDSYGLGGIPVMAGGLPFVQQPELYHTLGVRFAGAHAGEGLAQANALFASTDSQT